MTSSLKHGGECRLPLARTSVLPSALFMVMTIFLIVSHSSTEASQASVYLDNNSGYRGIIVSFSPDIQPSQRETVLLRLQDLFRRASELLFKATRGKAFYKQVTFLIPTSWSTSNWNSISNLKPIKKTHSRTVKDADFIVKSRDEAFSYNPLAIQAGGCGKQGIQIQLSEKFMTDATSDAVSLSMEGARLLLNQWVKYRYGVFDEKGFKNDPMYPLYWMTPGDGPGTEKITSCAASTDGPVDTIRTLNKTTTGEICSLQINHETGHPVDSKCIPQPDIRSNDNIISSLLSHPSLPNNQYFCEEHNHNKRAPNKHNNLCDGSSIWEVMNQHEDFRYKRDMNQPPLTSEERIVDFEYYQESDPRLAFIVDTEESLKNNIFSSLIRFSSGLPPSSELLMLDMKDEKSIHEHPDWTSQKVGLSSIWGRDSSSKGKALCLKCVVEEFLMKLNKLEGDSAADLIIVTPGVIQDSEQDVTTISESLITKGVSLRVVVYPYLRRRASHLQLLRELVSKVRGSIHLVTDSIHSHVSPKLLLFDVFDSFLTNNPNIRIARQSFQVPGDVDFKFSVDQSLLSKDIQLVTFFTSSSGTTIDAGQNYYLKSGTEKFTTKSPEYKTSNQDFQVALESREAGDWTLHYSSRKNDTLTGVAYATLSGHRTAITVKCYMTDYMANLSVPSDGSPPTLFVSVSQDLNQLVQNARVEVTLTDDLGNIIPSASNIPMIDDGLGTPDITRGDGIYSLYLTQLSDPGFYGVHVTVRSDELITKLQQSLSVDDEAPEDCCGSVVPERRYGNKPIHHLERYHDCGQIYMKEKYYPEKFVGKMKDVKVESVDTFDRKLTLTYTPPSGNYKELEVRMFTEDTYDMIKYNWDRGEYITRLKVEPYLRRQRFTYQMNNPSAGTYYFVFKVLGAPGTASTISNIIPVHFGPDRKNINSPDGTDSSYVTSQDTGNYRGLEPWQIVAISGGSIILLVLFCICICCMCLARKSKKKTDDQEAAAAASKMTGFGSKGGPNNPHPSSLTIHTTMGSAVNLSTEKINHSMMNHGLSTISHDQIHPHHNSELQATMSPIQSWDAGVILDHYQKVQQAKERKETPPIMKMEEVLLPRDGSCSSSSDNPSRESGSYDDNAFGMVHQGWRHQPMAYDNHSQFMGLPHQQVMMNQGYPSMYTDQYYVDPQPPIHWQEAIPYTTRSETPSDVTDSYDPRYAHPSQRRSTAAVSQV